MWKRYTVLNTTDTDSGRTTYRVFDDRHGTPEREHYNTITAAEAAAKRLNAEYEEFLTNH